MIIIFLFLAFVVFALFMAVMAKVMVLMMVFLMSLIFMAVLAKIVFRLRRQMQIDDMQSRIARLETRTAGDK